MAAGKRLARALGRVRGARAHLGRGARRRCRARVLRPTHAPRRPPARATTAHGPAAAAVAAAVKDQKVSYNRFNSQRRERQFADAVRAARLAADCAGASTEAQQAAVVALSFRLTALLRTSLTVVGAPPAGYAYLVSRLLSGSDHNWNRRFFGLVQDSCHMFRVDTAAARYTCQVGAHILRTKLFVVKDSLIDGSTEDMIRDAVQTIATRQLLWFGKFNSRRRREKFAGVECAAHNAVELAGASQRARAHVVAQLCGALEELMRTAMTVAHAGLPGYARVVSKMMCGFDEIWNQEILGIKPVKGVYSVTEFAAEYVCNVGARILLEQLQQRAVQHALINSMIAADIKGAKDAIVQEQAYAFALWCNPLSVE